jgi:hypothetical protein
VICGVVGRPSGVALAGGEGTGFAGVPGGALAAGAPGFAAGLGAAPGEVPGGAGEGTPGTGAA